MDDRLPSPFVAWVLGTFHTVALVVTLVWLVYPGGGLGVPLSGLSTLSGIAVFLALWAMTLFTTRRALAGIDWLADDPSGMHRFFWRALRWGAATGLLFLVVIVAALLLGTLNAASARGGVQVTSALFVLLLYGTVGSLVAATVGAVIGVALGALDIAALRIARVLTEPEQASFRRR